MAKEKPKTKWRVSVTRKKNQEPMDTLSVIAREKRWAARVGVIFTADHYGLGTSELEAEAIEWNDKEHGQVTHETHEYLAAAECDFE